MLFIEHSGHSDASTGAIADGVLARASSPPEFAHLLKLVIANMREPTRATTRPGETESEAQFRALTAQLLSMADQEITAEPTAILGDDAITGIVRSAQEGKEQGSFDSLVVALAGALEAWTGATSKEVVPEAAPLEGLLLLPMPGEQREAVLTFHEPRAVLEIRQGSVLTAMGVVGALRAKRWVVGLAAKARAFVGPSPRAGARGYVDRIRAQTDWARSFPRLDKLSSDERDRLRQSQLAVVLVHGLFATDRGTFDALVHRLENRSPIELLRRLTDEGDGLLETTQELVEPAEQFEAFKSMLLTLRQSLGKVEVNAVGQLQPRIGGGQPNQEPRGPEGGSPSHAPIHTATQLGTIDKDPPEPTRGRPASKAIPEALHRWADDRRTVSEVSQAAIGIVGFPHHTLDPIEDNGADLARFLREHLDPASTRVAFVCHSRGGLVARWAAARLRQNPEWHDRVTDVITFGTPHEGAELAEHKQAADFGAYLLAVNATRTAASLGEVLSYLQEYTTEGIFDLRPGGGATPERQKMFVNRLLEYEDQVGRACITAVGGLIDAAALKSWRQRKLSAFIAWKTGQGEHDMVVTTRSGLAERFKPDLRLVARCDHFAYFKASPDRQSLLLDAVAARLWSRIDVMRALRQARAPQGSPAKKPVRSLKDAMAET
jgi:pimeloyl-ACP methyl ester carboxylesterase